jgi:hypothetical protein
MPGAVLMVVVMVLVVPVAVMLGGAVWSALMGWTFTDEAATRDAAEPD